MVHYSKTSGNVVPGGVLEAAERFMVKWHEDEAQLSRQRHASPDGVPEGLRGGGAI